MNHYENQVLSRRVSLNVGEPTTVLDFNRPGELWRLSVQELDIQTSVLIKIKTGFDNSEEVIEFHCTRGSAVEYAVCNSAIVELQAVQANTTINIQLSPHYDNQFVLEYDENGQQVNNAAWVDVGGNQCYPRPYMNYCAIMTDAPIDVRTVAGSGAVVFQALNLATHVLLLNQLKIGNHDKLQVRGTVAAPATQQLRAFWYNRR